MRPAAVNVKRSERSSEAGMNSEKIKDLPTAAQLESEMKRIRYKRGYLKTLYNTVASLLVVAAVAVLISMLFLPVLRVTGESMSPTLNNDELIICNKRSNFKSGDIVAFYFNNKILLKRVIGTAGDVIDISEDGTVYVNGVILDEPYLSEKLLVSVTLNCRIRCLITGFLLWEIIVRFRLTVDRLQLDVLQMNILLERLF